MPVQAVLGLPFVEALAVNFLEPLECFLRLWVTGIADQIGVPHAAVPEDYGINPAAPAEPTGHLVFSSCFRCPKGSRIFGLRRSLDDSFD